MDQGRHAVLLKIPQQVDKTKPAAQQEDEHGDGRGETPRCEAERGQVNHPRQGETQSGAGRGDGLRERQPERDQVRCEEVDHERVAEAMPGVDRELGRKVVPVGERPRKAQVRGPVAPDVDVARVQPAWRVDPRLVEQVDGPRAAHEHDGQQRPRMAVDAKR